MQGRIKKSQGVGALLLMAGMLVAGGVPADAGQMGAAQQPSMGSQQSKRPTIDDLGASAPDPLKDKLDNQRAKMAVSERRKKLQADTDKLLQLATELKAEMDKTSKDELSLTVIKKAADIEKLAHDVKDRMKG